jgi:hypothetical protein
MILSPVIDFLCNRRINLGGGSKAVKRESISRAEGPQTKASRDSEIG